MLFTGFLALFMRSCSGHNIPEKGVRIMYKARVYTSLLRPEQGVRLINGCLSYTRNYGTCLKLTFQKKYILGVLRDGF